MKINRLMEELMSVFPIKPLPKKIIEYAYCDSEISDLKMFENKVWNDLSVDFLEEKYDSLPLMTIPAQHYFVPGIFYTGIANTNRDLLAYGCLVSIFEKNFVNQKNNRKNNNYTVGQLDVLEKCFLWLGEDEDAFDAEDLKNCLDGLEELRIRAKK